MTRVLTRELALSLNSTAGENRLREFCEVVEKGETPSPEVLAELAAQFRQILRGTPPKKAMDLERGRGRKPPSFKDIVKKGKAAGLMYRLMSDGLRYEDALPIVAEKTHRSEGTVAAYYSELKKLAPLFCALEEDRLKAKELAPVFHALIEGEPPTPKK